MKTEPNEPINAMLGFKSENIESMQQAGILYGLTKREYFAAMAMQGEMAAGGSDFTTVHCDHIAEISVKMADAIIKKLNDGR